MPVTDLPIPVRVTRYQCPHCPRTHSKKSAAITHIGRCWYNPSARGCKTCVHYTPAESGPYPEHPGWDEDCNALQDISGGPLTGCAEWSGSTDNPPTEES